MLYLNEVYKNNVKLFTLDFWSGYMEAVWRYR